MRQHQYPPAPLWAKAVAWVAVFVACVAVFMAAISGTLSGNIHVPAPRPPAPSSSSSTLTPTTAHVAAHPSGTTVAVFRGQGIANTSTFESPATWSLRYAYACPSGYGSSVVFGVMDDTLAMDVSVSGIHGDGSGIAYGDSGRHHLSVFAAAGCTWTLAVIAP